MSERASVHECPPAPKRAKRETPHATLANKKPESGVMLLFLPGNGFVPTKTEFFDFKGKAVLVEAVHSVQQAFWLLTEVAPRVRCLDVVEPITDLEMAVLIACVPSLRSVAFRGLCLYTKVNPASFFNQDDSEPEVDTDVFASDDPVGELLFGGEGISLADSIAFQARDSTLERLSLLRCSLRNADVEKVITSNLGLEDLTIREALLGPGDRREDDILTSEALVCLSGLEKLIRLNVSANKWVGPRAAGYTAAAPSLVSLDVSHCPSVDLGFLTEVFLKSKTLEHVASAGSAAANGR